MKAITIAGVAISGWIYAPVIYFIWVSIALILKKILFRWIEKVAKRTRSQIDDLLLESMNTPLVLLIFVSGTVILERISPLSTEDGFMHYFVIGFKVTTVIAIIMFLDKFLQNLLRVYGHKIEALRDTGKITQGFVRAIVIGLGALMLLDSFGVSITPILASLGIGSLAIALALQPTLENFFAGIQIVIDKPLKLGQFVKLDSGEEGYVEKIGWRSTWVRMLPNNVVVMPNKVFVNSKILNYYYPATEMAVLVQVGVHYDSDLKHVEKVTVEVGEEVMKTAQGGIPEFKPFIRYHTFNDFSIDFTVILRCKEFVDNYLIKHEFIKRLHERYRKEGIVIPYPIRAINNTQEKAD